MEDSMYNFNLLKEIGSGTDDIFKYYISYNTALKEDPNLSSLILKDFHKNTNKSEIINEIKEEIKKSVKLDFSRWTSSLRVGKFEKSLSSKCDKSSNCLSNIFLEKSIHNLDVNHQFAQNYDQNLPRKRFFNQNQKLDVEKSVGKFQLVENSLKMKGNSINDCQFSENMDTSNQILVKKNRFLEYCEPEHINRKEISGINKFKSSAPDNPQQCLSSKKSFYKEFGDTSVEKCNNSNLEFKTAREGLLMQSKNKVGNNYSSESVKKTLGTRRTPRSEFVLPIKKPISSTETNKNLKIQSTNYVNEEKLANIDPKMIELINNECINNVDEITWDDIAGLDYAKSTIKEVIIWPMMRPDIFTGIRRPPKGILFFGPPGTGKTLIGKCIASQSNSKFFSISSSSLTSKWIGEGEKMVRALFAVAIMNQPSVIFIDEIDSILCQRSESEHESSRRLKTEFLVQLDGAATSKDDKILIIGATNRPQELDDAARRRFERRLYIPLPELHARIKILENLLKNVKTALTSSDLATIGELTENYSGADMSSLCQEACMEPLRDIPASEMLYFDKNNVRPVVLKDFQEALKKIKPSISMNDISQYLKWNQMFGSGSSG